MGWVTGTAVYFVIWWLTLFLVLPWGVHPQGDSSEGHEAGAPTSPRVITKMAINTVVAGVFWAVVFVIDTYDLITLAPLAP